MKYFEEDFLDLIQKFELLKERANISELDPDAPTDTFSKIKEEADALCNAIKARKKQMILEKFDALDSWGS